MHRHDVGACELPIGGSLSTVAVVSRHRQEPRRFSALSVTARVRRRGCEAAPLSDGHGAIHSPPVLANHRACASARLEGTAAPDPGAPSGCPDSRPTAPTDRGLRLACMEAILPCRAAGRASVAGAARLWNARQYGGRRTEPTTAGLSIRCACTRKQEGRLHRRCSVSTSWRGPELIIGAGARVPQRGVRQRCLRSASPRRSLPRRRDEGIPRAYTRATAPPSSPGLRCRQRPSVRYAP
jgi:hypothetical protein